MSTNRKLVPSLSLIAYSLLIYAIVGYAVYYAFTEGGTAVRIAAIAAAVLILLPLLKLPIRISEDDNSIRIRQIVGEKVFMKKDYTIERVNTNSLFSIRLFATSLFLYWGYFWNKSLGKFYAQCVGNSNLVMLTKKSDDSKIVIDSPSI